jgi:hypothetical protein
VHNAVTTALQPEATLFPESMGLRNKVPRRARI